MKLSELMKKLNVEVELTEEQDKEIKGFIPQERFNEINEQKKQLQEQLQNQEKQMKELETFKGTAEEYQAKVKELSEMTEKQKQEYETKIKDITINSKIENALIEKGANKEYLDFLKSKVDKEKIVIDNDKFINLDEQINSLTETQKLMFGEIKAQGQAPSEGETIETSTNFENMTDAQMQEYFKKLK